MQGGKTTPSNGSVTLHSTSPIAPGGACSAPHRLSWREGDAVEEGAGRVASVGEQRRLSVHGYGSAQSRWAYRVLPQGWAQGQIPPVQVSSLAHVLLLLRCLIGMSEVTGSQTGADP